MNLPSTMGVDVPSYEQRLGSDPGWGMSEGSRHFHERSAVFDALRKITRRLAELGVPYAVVGGMALFQHGLRRFTEDVDILLSKEDLKKVHDALSGLGYLAPHRHSRHLRDVETGVRIEFLTTGDYPGDGREKPVAFPDPRSVSIEIEGVRYVNLPSLIELKLASGMTAPARLRDLSDVLELVKLLDLPADFAEQLNPYVREKYRELWAQGRRHYVALLRDAADNLEAMRRDDVVIENGGSDLARLVTTDPAVAKKYDMIEESEFWGGDENKPGAA